MATISYQELSVKCMERAWGHVKMYHFAKKRTDIEERVLHGVYNEDMNCIDKVNKASFFIGTEHNVQSFIVHALWSNKNIVFDWLQSSNKGDLIVEDVLPKKYVEGYLFDGTWHVSNKGKIILAKEKNIFRVKTVYPC